MGNSATVNGEKPHSQFISHLASYPVANDLITTYKNNSLGRKSLDIANTAYENVARPFFPYLQTPWSIVAPYVAKADSLADNGLDQVDYRFPIVREDTEKIKGTVMDYVYLPVTLAAQGRDYLFQTYHDEHRKVGGQDGWARTAKSIVSTELKVAGDVFTKLGEFFGPKKEAAKRNTELTREKIEKKYDETKQNANSKKDK
ncbi:MAG: hypothetical protein Q9165_001336 [Trypethelium subeluteriae]